MTTPRCSRNFTRATLIQVTFLIILSVFLIGNAPQEKRVKKVPVGPEDADALAAVGIDLVDHMRYEKALPFLNAAIEFKQNDPWLYYNRGYAHLKLLHPDKALLDLKRALEGATGHFSQCIRLNMGLAYYFSHDYAKAASLFKEYAARHPGAEITSFLKLWIVLAESFQGNDLPATAEKYLHTSSVSQWPDPLFAVFRGEKSVTEFTEDISAQDLNNEKLCEALYFMGQLYLLRNDVSAAMDMFQQAVDTEVVHFNEFTGSQYELVHLGLEQ